MSDRELNLEALKQLQLKVMQDVSASAIIPLMRIGDQLGIFKHLSELGEVNSEELANASNLDERYLREWLYAMSAAGFANYDSDKKKFSLSPEQIAVFANDDGPASMMGAYDMLTGAIFNEEKVKEAFKTGKGVDYKDSCPICFQGTARFFKPSYEKNLVKSWLPKIESLEKRMNSGASFADIGCGYGLSTMIIAETFPNARVCGYDIHGPSIDEAKKLAKKAGLENRIEYSTADAKSYEGKHDYIAFFDCLHDMGDPVGAAKYAYNHLEDDGSVILIEPTANDNPEDNFNLFGQMYYCFSTIGCVPTSKSQEVGLALGAQAGPSKLISVLNEAGFKNCKVVKKNASNMVIEARKN
jgi:2-polyprenyl-3-methyl-5-hydroxy-6-metoxy-1,4-benzoquinol methylase